MTIPTPADGQGTTLTFPGISANIIGIQAPTEKRAAIDATHLGTTGAMDSIPAKLIDAGEVSIDIEFDPAAIYPMTGAEGALAIGWASTVPATWTWARAILTSAKLPSVKTGERLTASLSFKLNTRPVVS